MSSWHSHKVNQEVKANEATARNTEKMLSVLENIADTFKTAQKDIRDMRQEISELKSEVKKLKDPKKSSLTFPSQKDQTP